VQKQLVILSLMMVPLISVTAASCSTDRASRDAIVAVTDSLPPSEFASKGGAQLTIRLKPAQQHPQISEADRKDVQRVIKGRIDGLGVTGAIVKSIGTDLILVQLPGVKDARQAERVLGGTAQLEFREQKAGTEERLSAKLMALRAEREKHAVLKKSQSPDKQAIAETQATIDRQYTEIGNLFDKATLTGGHLKEATAQPLSIGGWEVAIEFDDFGSNAFANLTKKMAGTGRSIGVFLDNNPISTPTVNAMFANTGITGGKAVIQGNFTAETASDLAIQIRGGSLPVPVEIVESRTIRPK
jgi:preprotein translocase subunit SecD